MINMGIKGNGRRTAVSVLLTTALVALLALGLASQALATKPTGAFVNFGDCPLSNPATVGCVYAQTTGGEFNIGSTEVPIKKTITLQGGLPVTEEEPLISIIPAADGNTLSKTPQTVPGGLLKILAPGFFPEPLKAIFNEFINKGITGVTATTELAGTPKISLGNALTKSGTALVLPVRVHLENSFLGSGCFIGSKAHPVSVEFTTGTTSPPGPNKPITGSGGELEIKEGGALLIDKNNSLVNNSFGAPEAEGCGSQILFGLFTWLVDDAVDAEVGLPSEPGHNTAILNGNEEIGVASAVKASEK
ncbi:MAG TPA: hypothetical protein VFW38_06990 [Solirubrobacteraceae bacterium]|nr:hypothetical protein [Solirubrobacteraceae bacterium]